MYKSTKYNTNHEKQIPIYKIVKIKQIMGLNGNQGNEEEHYIP